VSHSISNPLSERYAGKVMRELMHSDQPRDLYQLSSDAMREIFSNRVRVLGWRRIWLTLARIQAKLGVSWSEPALQAMETVIDQVDLHRIQELECETRHDVMAALHEFCEKIEEFSPGSSGLLHAGATSCLVTDNQDLISMRKGMDLLVSRLGDMKQSLASQGGSTEFQSRLERIADQISLRRERIRARGAKGTTGTQASYLELFKGRSDAVRALDEELSQELGFSEAFFLTSQTYPRLLDFQVLSTLALAGQSILGDQPHDPALRTLSANLQRMAAAACEMAGVQWLERSLDDSAQRRILIPEAFLSFDAILFRVQELGFKNCVFQAKAEFPRAEVQALQHLKETLVNCIERLGAYSLHYRDLPCLCYTHYQVAQPSSFGKRFCLWSYSLVLVLEELESLEAQLQKDPGDSEVSRGHVENVLNQLACVSSKIAADLRLLQHDGEVSEPFGRSQVGSSAMPYKRNPMRSERLSSLARLKWSTISYESDPAQALLNADALVQILLSVFQGKPGTSEGFQVHEAVVRRRFQEMAPFLSTEVFLMRGVLKGQDRQKLHESIRKAMLRTRQEMDLGGPNSFYENLATESQCSEFESEITESALLGRSAEQVDEFNLEICKPILERYQDALGRKGEVRI